MILDTSRSRPRLRLVALTLGLTLGALPACSGLDDGAGDSLPLDRKTAALTARDNTRDVLVGLSRAMAFLEESAVLEDVLGPVLRGDEESGVGGAVFCDPTGQCHEQPAPVPAEAQVEDGEGGLDVSFEDAAEELADWLDGHVFTDANFESEDGTSVTWRLRAASMCAPDEDDPEAEVSEQCTEFFSRAEIRVRVTSPADGDVDVALLVAPERYNALTFHLYTSELAISVDLSDSRDSLRYLMDAMPREEGEPEPALPERIEGKLRVALERSGEQRYTGLVSVTEDLVFSFSDAAEGERIDVRVAASERTLELGADGVARTALLAWNVGAVELTAPLRALMAGGEAESDAGEGAVFVPAPGEEGSRPPPSPEGDAPRGGEAPAREYHGVISALLAGFTGRVTLDGGDVLELKGLGLGDGQSRVSLDGQLVGAVDLNAASGRKLDARVSRDAAGDTQLELAPELDVTVQLALRVLADQREDLPDWSLDDTLHGRLGGAERPTLAMRGGADGEGDGRERRSAMQLVSGELTLESRARPDLTSHTTAPMCLYGVTGEVGGGSSRPVEAPVPGDAAPAPDGGSSGDAASSEDGGTSREGGSRGEGGEGGGAKHPFEGLTVEACE